MIKACENALPLYSRRVSKSASHGGIANEWKDSNQRLAFIYPPNVPANTEVPLRFLESRTLTLVDNLPINNQLVGATNGSSP